MTWLKHTVHMIMLCSNPKHTPLSGILQPNLLNRETFLTNCLMLNRAQNKKNSYITPLYLGGRQWSSTVNYGSISVSGQLPTYPFPNPTFTPSLTQHQP